MMGFLGFKTYFITAGDEENNIHAILPLVHVKNWMSNKLDSVAYSQYGGFIGDVDYFKPIIEKSIDLKNKLGCTHITIKQPPDSKIDDSLFEEMGLVKKEHLDQYLLLKNPEILWQEFNESTRRTIKKTSKRDIIVKRVTEDSEIKQVHELAMKFGKKVGFLAISYKDYLNMFKKLNELGISEIFIAKWKNKVISHVYLVNYKDNVLYRSGASSSEGRKLAVHRLITWEAIQWSYNKGYKIFDFGPSGPLNQDGNIREELRGLIDYKSFFNSIKTSYKIYYYSKSPKFINKIGTKTWKKKMLKKILKIIPVFILKRTGSFIVRKFI